MTKYTSTSECQNPGKILSNDAQIQKAVKLKSIKLVLLLQLERSLKENNPPYDQHLLRKQFMRGYRFL